MYGVTDRMYRPIEEANKLKENFLINDSVHNNIGNNKMSYFKMQYKSIGLAKNHHKETGDRKKREERNFCIILCQLPAIICNYY